MPLLKAQYINHIGNKIGFGEDWLFLNQHDLMNFSWNVQTRGNRIVGVDRRGVKEHTLPLIIVAPTKEKACERANYLFSVCEADLQANEKGRLVVNGYNLKCFIRGQDYTEWSDLSKCLKISARVIRDSIWYKTLDPITFNENMFPQINVIEEVPLDGASPAGGSQSSEWTGGEKGYYHGYPYDYPSTTEKYVFENKEGVPLSWKAVIYGSASSPLSFTIAGHVYSVNTSLGIGERLEITAKEALDEKTVIKYEADGDAINCFANRNTESYLFETIPTGANEIQNEDGLVWRLIPIVERSAPEWL